MSRYGEDERVIVLRDGGREGVQTVVDEFLTNLLREALGKKKRHDDDDDEKKIKRRWSKPVNKEVVACWTLLLMAASPWIGLKMLTMYASLLGQYAGILNQFVK